MSDAFFQLQKTIAEVGRLQARLLVENQRLRDENKRLRELVKEMEDELKEAGAVSWRTPDDKALDADLLREDAHERKRLESEYPWKE
ncbi:MAG: hypothetical protein ACK6DM_12235 [Alphaproteobacteria bacterium]|jgi:regulator of replication initiation timing